jgi:glycosyltransferase involved in cell wall biosynthesis
MKLAILLPVKDGANIILDCLNSIYHQTAFKKNTVDYEIILVDNNSTDNLKEKIKNLNNIKYLFCNIPGIVPTMNTGIYYIMNNSHFEYIARIDADDLWHETKIEKQLNFLLKNKDIDICGTQMHFISENNTIPPFQYTNYPLEDIEIKKFLINGMNPFGHSSIIYKKNIFLKFGGYDETYKYAEDFDLWLKCFSHYKFANLNECLVDYKFDRKYGNTQNNNAYLAYKRFLETLK